MLMIRLECPKLTEGIYKKIAHRAINFVVDWDEKTWNTFIKIVLDWEPILREIYTENP